MPELNRADVPPSPPAEGEQQRQPAGLQQTQQQQQQEQPPAQQQPPAPEEYVYPDDPSIPEQFRGKKASEAAGLFTSLFDTSKRMAEYLRSQGAQPPAAQQQQQQQQQDDVLFERDDFIAGEPAAIQQKIEKLFERKAAPFLVDVYRGLTMSSMNTARQMLPHFAKYETEIMQELAQTPVNVTAHFNTWKDAHDRVVARHIDDIVASRTTRPPAPVTERGGNGSPSDRGMNTVEMNADDVKIADGLGVPRDVFLRMKALYANAERSI